MGVVNAVYSASTGGNGYRLRSEVAGKQQEKIWCETGDLCKLWSTYTGTGTIICCTSAGNVNGLCLHLL